MQQVKDYCSQLCREYGLSVTESKADPFRIPTWKRRLTDHIKEASEMMQGMAYWRMSFPIRSVPKN
jgi:hypothetical protein